MEKINLDLLTDEAILDYTTDEDGRGRVLTDYHDINMKYATFKTFEGGVYDANIFGSPMIDRCLCGKLQGPSDHPCPECGCRVYTIEDGLRRFARIELPFYYLSTLRFEIFKDFFDDLFKDSKIEYNFVDNDLRKGGYSKKGAKKLELKVFDSCQFDYDPKKRILTISEFIDDESKCSYEGLIKICEENFPNHVLELKRLVNRLYIVLPSMMRPFSYSRKYDPETKKMKSVEGVHKMSTWYGIIIRLCCAECEPDKVNNYLQVMEKFKTPGARVRYTALLRALLNAGKKEATELLNASKKNLARSLYAVRTKSSLRCPIVPDPSLKIDEVSLPRHLVYEMCRSGFCKYLQENYNFTEEQAKLSTRDEYDNPEIQKKFKEYAESQVVINL